MIITIRLQLFIFSMKKMNSAKKNWEFRQKSKSNNFGLIQLGKPLLV